MKACSVWGKSWTVNCDQFGQFQLSTVATTYLPLPGAMQQAAVHLFLDHLAHSLLSQGWQKGDCPPNFKGICTLITQVQRGGPLFLHSPIVANTSSG